LKINKPMQSFIPKDTISNDNMLAEERQ